MSFIEDLIIGWFECYVYVVLQVASAVFNVINDLVVQFLPVMEDLPVMFNDFIDTYICPSVNYFVHLLPPNAMNLFILYITCLLGFYSITLAIHLLIKAFELIKSIKIW